MSKTVKKEMDPENEKEYKNLYLTKSAIKLLEKITFLEKVDNSNYTFGDTIYDALILLADKKGIKL